MSHHRLSLPLAVLVCAVAAGPVAAAPTVSSLAPSAGEQTSREAVTIQDTINATLHQHHALKAIQENREAVAHEVTRAKAGYGPRLDVTGAVGAGKLSNSTTRSLGVDKGFYNASRVGATLVQPLWDGLATRSRVRTAESTLDSMNYRVFDNATSLGLDALIAHIDVLRRRTIYDLAEANVARHEEILAQARDRESLGADTMADVTQAESRLARAQSLQVEARASLREGEETYYRLHGMRPTQYLDEVPVPSPLPDGPARVMEAAERSNPKLEAYIQDIKSARGEEELSRSAYHPSINLEVGPNYTDRGGKGSQWTYSFDVMGTVRWNIFNSGADVAETKAARARVRQARQTMYSFVDDLKLEIETTWTQYLSAREQFKHYTDAIGFNTATRDAYEEQFMLGQRSLLDVLDAESELFNSSTQAATARGNILVGAYRLQALAGVLLPDLGIDTSFLDKAPSVDPADPREAW